MKFFMTIFLLLLINSVSFAQTVAQNGGGDSGIVSPTVDLKVTPYKQYICFPEGGGGTNQVVVRVYGSEQAQSLSIIAATKPEYDGTYSTNGAGGLVFAQEGQTVGIDTDILNLKQNGHFILGNWTHDCKAW